MALTEALLALQAANESKTAFLTEEALASDLVLAQLEDGAYETLEEALEAFEDGDFDESDIETAIADALDSGEGEQGAEQVVATRLADVNGAIGVAADALDGLDDTDFSFDSVLVTPAQIAAFTGSSRAVQDTLVAETQAALTEAVTEVEAAVSEVTGLSGRVATLQARKAELNTALEAQGEAEAAFVAQAALLASLDIDDAAECAVFHGALGFDDHIVMVNLPDLLSALNYSKFICHQAVLFSL